MYRQAAGFMEKASHALANTRMVADLNADPPDSESEEPES